VIAASATGGAELLLMILVSVYGAVTLTPLVMCVLLLVQAGAIMAARRRSGTAR
jgi:hypothetical protein